MVDFLRDDMAEGEFDIYLALYQKPNFCQILNDIAVLKVLGDEKFKNSEISRILFDDSPEEIK